jgi:hypothetical protein
MGIFERNLLMKFLINSSSEMQCKATRNENPRHIVLDRRGASEDDYMDVGDRAMPGAIADTTQQCTQ